MSPSQCLGCSQRGTPSVETVQVLLCVAYLGHVVSANGITPDPQKVAAVLQFSQPTEAKTLQQFLGLTNYRKFIHNYASIAEPLHRALKGHKKFQWTPSCQQAFDFLKSKLTSPPILGYPDFSQPFILHSDASANAIGAVLSQISIWQRDCYQLLEPSVI